jgi:hypothetical protein
MPPNPDPIYTADNVRVAFELRYAGTFGPYDMNAVRGSS